MSDLRGLTVHIVIPRADPLVPGLSEFYAKIKQHPAKHKESRHLLPQELSLMHRSWRNALYSMAKIGCVEWIVSHRAEDALSLPQQDQNRTQSAQPASIGFGAHSVGTVR
jgi:hypothetical protein